MHKIQAGFTVRPISRFGQAVEPVVGTVDPGVDMKTPPKTQVDTMPAGKFFAYAAEILKLQPPHITDEPILAQMRRIGIERGKSFDIGKLDPATKAALESVPKDALALMAWKVNSMARVVDGWSMNTDTMGVYGNYYLKRAIVTQLGLGANLPEDAIYPINLWILPPGATIYANGDVSFRRRSREAGGCAWMATAHGNTRRRSSQQKRQRQGVKSPASYQSSRVR